MRTAIAASILLAAFPLAAQQRDFSAVEIKVTQVSGSVYMLEGAGGNIAASIGEDGTMIVDDQFAPLVPKIEAALRKIKDQPVRFVLNTHWHGDHTGGNEPLGRTATIVAHTNVRKRMSAGVEGRYAVPSAPAVALPVVTFDEELSIHLNGEEIRAIHYPKGHTDGDSVIHFTKSNVFHLGDNLFHGMFPFIDLDSGGSVRGLIAATKKVIALMNDDVKIIPGHGKLANLADLRDNLRMLEGTAAIVEKGIKAGKSVGQLKEEKVLSAYEKYSWRFVPTDRFIETLYLDLKRPAKKK
jgi:cyclase